MWPARNRWGVSQRNALRHELDRLFDSFVERDPFAPVATTRPFPALNIWEDNNRLMVEAEVPGLSLEALEILVQGNELTIKGQRRPAVTESEVYHRRERGTGEFTRFVTLPYEIESEGVEATLKDGVLTIVLPQAEKVRARKIQVKSS